MSTSSILFEPRSGIFLQSFAGYSRSFAPHFHDHYVLAIIKDGCRKLKLAQESLLLSRGQCMLLSPRQVHSCSEQHNQALCLRALCIPKSCFNVGTAVSNSMLRLKSAVGDDAELFRLLDQSYEQLQEQALQQQQHQHQQHQLPQSNATGFAPCANTHTQSQTGTHARIHNSHLNELYVYLKEQYATTTNDTDSVTDRSRTLCLAKSSDRNLFSGTQPSVRMQRLLSYMEAHLSEPLTLKDLCVAAGGCSVSTLLCLFNTELGITPRYCLNAMRVNAAKIQLKSGMPLSEVATSCGFADQSHLNHAFQRLEGISPGMLRTIFRMSCK